MPFFAVWRNRMQGSSSWLETSAGYSTRAEAETVTPEREGTREPAPHTVVFEAATDVEARSLYQRWEVEG